MGHGAWGIGKYSWQLATGSGQQDDPGTEVKGRRSKIRGQKTQDRGKQVETVTGRHGDAEISECGLRNVLDLNYLNDFPVSFEL